MLDRLIYTIPFRGNTLTTNNASMFNQNDLIVYYCGQEICKPEHRYGPAMRDHFLIHFILEGQGSFTVGEQSYQLGPHQGFLIYPNQVVSYQADKGDPWHYAWAAFQGTKASIYLQVAGLSESLPIFSYNRDSQMRRCVEQMVAVQTMLSYVDSREFRLLGYLYQLFALLIEADHTARSKPLLSRKDELYVNKALAFIEHNYSHKINVEMLAAHVALNRSYFGSIFKASLGQTPQQYLMQFRVNKASELLQITNLSIGDIARSVGYDDPLLFSKVFKRLKGVSPRHFRSTG